MTELAGKEALPLVIVSGGWIGQALPGMPSSESPQMARHLRVGAGGVVHASRWKEAGGQHSRVFPWGVTRTG